MFEKERKKEREKEIYARKILKTTEKEHRVLERKKERQKDM